MERETQAFDLKHPELLARIVQATSPQAVEELLRLLPVVSENDYLYDSKRPAHGWQEGKLHWVPVGGDRGNDGRIRLAGSPENPIAERTVNAAEALIELERHLELLRDAGAAPPGSPRDAVLRYFRLPPLEEVPGTTEPINGLPPKKYARELARRVRVRLVGTKKVGYTVVVEDDGIGQAPARMHETLLSLGAGNKGDKPYLIGAFGQGGSSAYKASRYSWVVSRRHPRLRGEAESGAGWTIVKRIPPKVRGDGFYAYLATHPDGRVPEVPGAAADSVGLRHGTRIGHVGYDFGTLEPARELYNALNHLLFHPLLPYELITGPDRTPDPMYGNAYRLSNLSREKKALDKSFTAQTVTK
jgi:hypothetical protein